MTNPSSSASTYTEAMTVRFDDGGDKKYSALVAARRKSIKTSVGQAQALDLCFLMDATLSMQKYIDYVKEEIAGIVAAITGTYPACNVRVSCVIYRDYGDKIKKSHKSCDFTSDFGVAKSKFKKYLSSLRAQGGGDTPEDIFTGLEGVAKLDWKAANRVFVHIGDSPCHGTRFHDFGSDSDDYPKGDKLGRNIEDLLQKLHTDCSISQYLFCHLHPSTKKMLGEFKKVVQADGFKKVLQVDEFQKAIQDNEFEWIQDVDIKDMGNIVEQIIKSACQTISKTLSTSVFNTSGRMSNDFKGLELMTNSVVPDIPDWEHIKPLKGRRLKHKWYGASSMETLFTKIRKREPFEVEKLNAIEIKIAANPFTSEGNSRWPFHASMVDPDGSGDRNMVVKRFKKPDSRVLGSFHSEDRYLGQMEVQTMAAHLASDFNNSARNICVPSLRRVEVQVVTVLNAGLKYFNMEKFLQGEWNRFSSNGGYVNPKLKEYAETLHAFTHWTYERSGGLLMVTDLQGVIKPTEDGNDYRFLLSDPAIHCLDLLRFSATNLGDFGFNLFFQTHECNDICNKLDLPKRSRSKAEA